MNTKTFPRTNDYQTIYLNTIINNPNIIVGDYTIYNDFVNDPTQFEKNNVLYHYPINQDRLIIGKFCSIACGAKFLFNSANHTLKSLSNYTFPLFFEEWGLDDPVEEGYLDMLLERERKFPTGLCTKPFAVALPHTEPDHVIKPCIAVAKLRRPVEFHEMVNDQNTVDVRFIFNLVLQKTEQQLELLQKIISIFSDKEAMEQLEKEQEPEKIAEILEHTKIGINT